MSKGYVYILSNPSMPGILKIGKTTRSVEQRCHELWQTGVPTPFEVESQVYTPDCHLLEAAVHAELADYRVSLSREFFRCEAKTAVDVLDKGFVEQIYSFIDEYAAGLVLVPSHQFIDGATINRLAVGLGEKPEAISHAIDRLTPEELAPAMARARAEHSNTGSAG